MDHSLRKKNGVLFRCGRFSFTVQDLVALAVFAAAAAVFFISAPYGITEPDEAFYQTVPYRLLRGDALLADEWHMVQLNAMFWYLPYRVFTLLSGGTEGLLLFLRYVYAAVKLVFYITVYLSLRSYGYASVFAAAVYVGSDVFGFKTLNYYSVCANACLLAGLLLFIRKEPKPLHVILAGFLFSMGVLAEPPAALVWAAYTVAVFVGWLRAGKNKPILREYDFILNARVWRLLLYGVLIGFVLFAAALTAQVFVFAGRDLSSVWAGIRQMLFSSEYSVNGQFFAARLEKIPFFAHAHTAVLFLLFFVLMSVAFIRVRSRNARSRAWFAVLGSCAVVLSVLLFVYPLRSYHAARAECASHPLFFALLGLPAYVFTKNKNRKAFGFWLFSVCVSLCVDLVSDCTFGSLLYLACVPAALLARDYFREQRALQREEKTPAKRGKNKASPRAQALIGVLLTVTAVFFPVYELAHYGYMAWFHETEYVFYQSDAALTATVPSGVYRGVRTLPGIAQDLALAAEDAETVRGMSKNGLFVAGLLPSFYMDADADIRTYTSFAWILDGWRQTELWWRLYPEKRPDVIYVPEKDINGLARVDMSVEEKLAWLEERADITVTQGRIGKIVQINAWY